MQSSKLFVLIPLPTPTPVVFLGTELMEGAFDDAEIVHVEGFLF